MGLAPWIIELIPPGRCARPVLKQRDPLRTALEEQLIRQAQTDVQTEQADIKLLRPFQIAHLDAHMIHLHEPHDGSDLPARLYSVRSSDCSRPIR